VAVLVNDVVHQVTSESAREFFIREVSAKT
jgi:hypothetical protein